METPDRTAPLTIVEAVLEHARRRPEAVALIAGATEFSYRQLAHHVRHAACALKGQCLQPGQRVLIEASSTPAFVVSYLAVHLSHCIAVPMDAGMPEVRRDYISGSVGASLRWSASDQEQILTRAERASKATANSTPSAPFPPADRIADLIFTSGTTGVPKGVILTHGNLVSAARQIVAFVGTKPPDVEVLPLPLGHNFGLASLRSLLWIGATVVLVDGFSFPGRVYAALKQHRASSFRCVPAGLAMMLRFAPDRLAEFADQIRYVELGSAPMPLEDKLKLMELLPRARICMHYGLTEASRSVFIEFNADRTRLNSIGRPSEGVSVRITGSKGEVLGNGMQGEIQISGRHVTPGYWNDPERTAKAFDGEWFCTGDAGHQDEAGYLYLHGRNAEMINVGGRKVSPAEVEDALRTHPAVRDCGCSAISDPAGLTGDAVAVLVLFRDGYDASKRELRDHLRKQLEAYKIPVKWVFSGTLPRTANGKLQRHLLRTAFESATE